MVFVMGKKTPNWNKYEGCFLRLLLSIGFEILELGNGSKLYDRDGFG